MEKCKLIAGMVGIAASAVLAASPARAASIGFDPDGGGDDYLRVATFDLAPGNALHKGIGSLLTNKSEQLITIAAQSRLIALLDENSDDISPSGLNHDYEITVYLEYAALANVAGSVTSYTQTEGGTMFEVWFDSNTLTKANDLAGTGFRDGTQILGGSIHSGEGVFQRFGSAAKMDQFGSDNYAAFQTLKVVGGGTVEAGVSSALAGFFQQIPPALKLALLDTAINTPYVHVDPARAFNGYNAVRGGQNGTGTDFTVQTDATMSFEAVENSIPLPATVWGGLAMIGAMVGRRAMKLKA